MTDIPEDVMELAREHSARWANGSEGSARMIAAALMADRAAQAERMARLEEALREARNQFDVEYRGDRISCVGHASDGLRKIVGILDAALAARALSQEGSDA